MERKNKIIFDTKSFIIYTKDISSINMLYYAIK